VNEKVITWAFWISIAGSIILILGIILGFVIPLCIRSEAPRTLADTIIVSKLIFGGLGLAFAIFQLFLGVLLALIGITSPVNVAAQGGGLSVKIVAASPAIVLIIAASVLFGFCLMRPLEYDALTKEVDKTKTQGTAQELPTETPFAVPPLKPHPGKP
jgi:hypothetical protein